MVVGKDAPPTDDVIAREGVQGLISLALLGKLARARWTGQEFGDAGELGCHRGDRVSTREGVTSEGVAAGETGVAAAPLVAPG